MAIYIAREATKIWRKMRAEATVELQLLVENWRLLLAGNVFQVSHEQINLAKYSSRNKLASPSWTSSPLDFFISSYGVILENLQL